MVSVPGKFCIYYARVKILTFLEVHLSPDPLKINFRNW